MSIERLAGKIRELPSLPLVVTEVIALVDRPEADIADVERKISQDQSLTARILRIANSPFYGFSGRIGTVKDGLVLLGMHAVRNLVIAAGIMKQFPAGGAQLHRLTFWQHCIGTSVVARVLAQRLGMDKEVAFTAGLLHDIGKLALDCHLPEEYTRVLQHRRGKDCLLTESEEAVLGFDHARVGGELARRWKLPGTLVAAIEGHHRPDGPESCLMGDLVHVSDIIGRGLDIGNGNDDLISPLHCSAMARLGLRWTDLRDSFAEIEAGNRENNLLLRELL